MDLVRITQDNVATACRIQHLLFPGKGINADRDFVNGFLQPERGKEYWLLQVGEDYVGIAGLYSIRLDPETAWLAWFGILPEFRRRGYATEALGLFEARARERGFLYARLFTERADDAAIACYRKNGYFLEEYNCPTDAGAEMVPMYVMSKSLYPDRECPKWGDRDIGLWRQFTKQVERLYE